MCIVDYTNLFLLRNTFGYTKFRCNKGAYKYYLPIKYNNINKRLKVNNIKNYNYV